MKNSGLISREWAAEQLPLADDSFVVAYGDGVLHHLFLPMVGAEIARVPKQGGKAVCKYPLGHNPVLESARDHLPRRGREAAKGTERPLKFGDVGTIGQHFTVCMQREFDLCSTIPILLGVRRQSKSEKEACTLDDYALSRCAFLGRFCRHDRREIGVAEHSAC